MDVSQSSKLFTRKEKAVIFLFSYNNWIMDYWYPVVNQIPSFFKYLILGNLHGKIQFECYEYMSDF